MLARMRRSHREGHRESRGVLVIRRQFSDEDLICTLPISRTSDSGLQRGRPGKENKDNFLIYLSEPMCVKEAR